MSSHMRTQAARRFAHPHTPFPIGVEYYRGGAPKRECWDDDFANIRGAGFRIVRSASYWNWMEPSRDEYRLEDYDEMFDLAAKHGLSMWLDVMLATHGAAPEWMTRDYPDFRAVNHRGQALSSNSHPAYPQGGMIHCYDHPIWRERGGNLLRHVVNRYKDHPAAFVWGIWDGIALSSQWVDQDGGYPCYCEHSIARYSAWLQAGFTLEEFNARTLRRYRCWDDVEPPRSNDNVLEMLLFKQFNYENLAGHLRWMIGEVRKINPVHETRAHGAWFPRPWDEICAASADSWGMSMPSNNLLTGKDPYKVAERAFAFDWSRSIGRGGRWWNEEIYSGMSRGGVVWKKQTDPRELTTLLWMTLAHGAAGAMFWQYRPDYAAFESPGYNLAALDGRPTPRLVEVSEAILHIDGISDHLPLQAPKAQAAVVNHQSSHDLFTMNDEGDRFLDDLRGTYRALWSNGIPVDVVTPSQDWSGYRIVFMPNAALMTGDLRDRMNRTLTESSNTALVAAGSFGMYSSQGLSSYRPPDGFSERFGVRVSDLSSVDGCGDSCCTVQTAYGSLTIQAPIGYAVLETDGRTKGIASIDGQNVAVQTPDGRFAWYGFSLSAGFCGERRADIVLGIVRDAGVQAPVALDGDRVIPIVRESAQGGRLLFLFNLERADADVFFSPRWNAAAARDILNDVDLCKDGRFFYTAVPQWGVRVIHLPER